MGQITFILGGARSGKSSFALKLTGKKRKVAFVATGVAGDKEMQKRIISHQKSRPANWKTFEEPQEVATLLKKIGSSFEVIIVDCLTLLVSNLLCSGLREKVIEDKLYEIIQNAEQAKSRIIIVSNEVGLGIVPRNKMAREFRDIAGRINQIFASAAQEVFFLVSGIPWRIK